MTNEACERCGEDAPEFLLETDFGTLCTDCDYEICCELQDAARFEYHAHGDTSGLEGHPSEYDLDPGVRYNDGGEPIGYM